MKKIVTLLLKNLISKVTPLLLLLLGMSVISAYAAEPETKPLTLGTGIWEGISDGSGVEYYMLVLAKDGKHRVLRGNLATAFRQTQQFMFTDENISCSQSECILSIDNPYEKGHQLRMILAPTLTESFNVLEINTGKEQEPILSRTFQLDKQLARATVSRFVARYRDTISALAPTENKGLDGFWLGVVTHDQQKDLVVLDIDKTGAAELVVFFNGEAITNETAFQRADIEQLQEVYEISTNHKTFANKINIHQINENLLRGNYYSYHEGKLLENSYFQLHRIKQ
ncbi:MAG: hypothetical protein GJ680_12380 [Alteromonadaceae bacterium]|nr:hypothetical protein [Alteromonadaceae bacterium]